MSASGVDRLIRRGDLTSVAPSLYQVFPSDDHVDLVHGALLALPGAVVSHQSAAHLLGFPRLPKLEPTVTVASHTTHVFPGVTVRRSLDLERSHMTTVNGLRTTNIARTAFDLAGVLECTDFVLVVEGLLIADLMKVRHLQRMLDQLGRRGRRGTANSRSFISLRTGGDPKASVLEHTARQVLSEAGLPAPVPEYPIPWDERRRFDDAYPEATFAIEWDSRSWHAQEAAMTSDRKRDRDAATHGWVVIRFTWADVTERPSEVVNTVQSLLQSRTQPKSADS